MKRFICILAVILSIVIVMPSCSYFEAKDGFMGGQLLDDELLADIREEIFSTRIYDDDLVENFETEALLTSDHGEIGSESSEDGLVYWTEGGGVWHIYRDCGHLKKSNNVISGSRDDAAKAGKTKVCSTCSKKEGP